MRPTRRQRKLTPLRDDAYRQHWCFLGNERVETCDGLSRSEMTVTLDGEVAQLAGIERATAQVERHPALVAEVRRNAQAGIHFQRSLAFDAHPELRGETLAVVVQH